MVQLITDVTRLLKYGGVPSKHGLPSTRGVWAFIMLRHIYLYILYVAASRVLLIEF